MRSDFIFLGRTNFRRGEVPFGIRTRDRLLHQYVIGKTGTGKSTLLESMALQDAAAGRGMAFIDPHGETAERLVRVLAPLLGDRLIYLDAADAGQPFGYNPLRRVRADKIPLAVSGLLETLRKLWPDAWGMRMEHVLRNCLFALLETDGAALPDILDLLQNKNYRRAVTRLVSNQTVREFWKTEYESYSPRLRAEAIMPIQNKLGALLADPLLYRVLVEPKQELRFRSLMDEQRVLIVSLSKGRIGEDSAHILGALLVSTIGLAAFSRAEVPSFARRPFFLYLDEFQNFTTLSLVNMMAELRKYGAALVMAHQHLDQLDTDIRQAVLGNVGTVVSFRVGPNDAATLAPEFAPKFGVEDLANLPNRRIYLKMMIDGAPSPPFSANTLAPAEALALLARPKS